MHWMTREGALMGPGASGGSQLDAMNEDEWRFAAAAAADLCGSSPSKRVVCRMKMDGEFLDSADPSGPCRVAMPQSSLPKCRCPSSARAWPRLLAASLCVPSDKKTPRWSLPQWRKSSGTLPDPHSSPSRSGHMGLGPHNRLISKGSCATLRGSPGHAFQPHPLQ
jgi:hypothetical protein